jgi:uncharacterized RDD family membrane protein YckC
MPELNVYADQLNIETPEQVDLHFPVAGIGSRFIAVLLDTIFQLIAYFLLLLVIYLITKNSTAGNTTTTQSDSATKWVEAAIIFFHFLLYWGYYALFEAYWNGQTPGKRLMKLRVLKDSGRSITLFESMARNLVRVIDFLPSFYVVGLISMLCNKQNKRLGDLIAGTIVVHERMDEQPLMSHISRTFTSSIYPEQSAVANLMPRAREEWATHESGLPADAVARLQPGDLHTIEIFFSRALDLSVEKREELGTRLAATMSAKMQYPLPEGVRPERLLELIALKMRSQGRG